MFIVNSKAAEILDIVTADLATGAGRIIDNAPGVFLPLSVRREHVNRFEIEHFSDIQLPDPKVEFWRAPDGGWVPVSIVQVTGYAIVAVDLNGQEPTVRSPHQLAELVEFCNTWIGDNLPAQQGGIDALRAASADPDNLTF
jgi:hypothetical protein